jgi:hypothetical protein
MSRSEHQGHDVAASWPNLNAAVTGLDRRTLDAIYRHPLAHNVSWREVVTLLTAIGEAEEQHNGEYMFRAGGEHLSMQKPHDKDLTGSDVMELRHFLNRAGWSPDAHSLPQADMELRPSSLIVVIDHAGAKIYRIDGGADDSRGVIFYNPEHLLHHIERAAHDTDRDEKYPEDERFFEHIASALSVGGKIVVIGHGKGQSNEADHLSAFLLAHHKDTHARIVREMVADLPHLTTPELVQLGVHALGPG